MFSIFQDKSPEAEKKQAAALFEKVVSSKADTREARSLRARIALLCRAHLDKTFVAGAELADHHDTLAALALAQGSAAPEPPQAPLFHVVSTGERSVYTYLPKEYAEVAFTLGARYQRTEITAQQAIDSMQGLANQLFLYELRLDEPLQVLQFLRDELAGGSSSDEVAGYDKPAAGAN
jgi:hypothetical protein